VELFHRDEGHGPPILLLHGLGGDHTVWNAVVPKLLPDHRVLLPDLRGHGKSTAPPGSAFGFSEFEADLEALLDKVGEPSVHIVGLSAGGFLGLQLAVDHPARARSLVVMGAAAHCDGHTRAIAERWAETFRTEGYDAYILRLLKDLFYPDWIEANLDFADRLREDRADWDPRGAVSWAQVLRSFDHRGPLGRLQMPTLVVHGVDDQVVDPAHGRLLRQTIRGAELRLFRDTGHMIPIERPAETADLLKEWVARQEAARGNSASP
jgi:3-oxoadipate enol-lactonase